ncbi:hypothetical protein EC991_003518 [Linnemannia zychae]|nr:hypothetical protein EC991_003518 [Linnemannia zychae]
MVAPKIELLTADTGMETPATVLPVMEITNDETSVTVTSTIGISAEISAPAHDSPKAYQLRERRAAQCKPYSEDYKRAVRAGVDLGAEEPVQISKLKRGKHFVSADLQEDEDDSDYEEGEEDPADSHYGREESMMEEWPSSARLSARLTLDLDQEETSSVNPSVPRRRLYQRRDSSANTADYRVNETETEQAQGGEGLKETGDVQKLHRVGGKDSAQAQGVAEDSTGMNKCRVLPRSFFGKNGLLANIEALKQTRREESSSGPARKAARTDQGVPQLAHHAKRRIVSEGGDDHALGDFLARLAQDNGQSESDSDRNSDKDSDRTGSSLSRSPSPRRSERVESSHSGMDHGYDFSDGDDALEVVVRTFPTQATKKRSYSAKKSTATPRTVRQPGNRLTDFHTSSHAPAIKRGRVDGGRSSDSKVSRQPKFHSPYTYADPHESNKEREFAIHSGGLTPLPVGRKRKASEDSAPDSYYNRDPYAARKMMLDTRFHIKRNATSRRAHILLLLGSPLRYSSSDKRARLNEIVDPPPSSSHLSEESGAESDSTLRDFQGAEFNITRTHSKLSPDDPDNNYNNNNHSYNSNSDGNSNRNINNNNTNLRNSGAGQHNREVSVGNPSKQRLGDYTHRASGKPRQSHAASSSSTSSTRHRTKKRNGLASGQWINTGPPVQVGIAGFREWNAEQKRRRQEKDNAVPLPPQFITRPTFTLPPLPTPLPTPLVPSRLSQIAVSKASVRDSRDEYAAQGSRNTAIVGDPNARSLSHTEEIEEEGEQAGLPPILEDVRAYMAEGPSRNKAMEMFRLNRRAKCHGIVGASPVTGIPIHAEVRFSGATYIGNGSLSRLLKAAWTWRQDNYLPREALTDVVVMGVPFPSDWSEKRFIEFELGSAVFELQKSLTNIQDRSHQIDSDSIEKSLADLSVIIQALEGLTTVLINGLNCPILMGRHRVWQTFQSHVVNPLQALAEAVEVRVGQSYSSPVVTSMLWLRWAVASWHFLNESAGHDEECPGDCSMGVVCTSLLEYLFKADDTSFFDAVDTLRDRKQDLRDPIDGKDVLQIWICLIHTLNQSARHHHTRGFWTYFNSQVGRTWAEEEKAMADVSEATLRESRSWRGRRLLDLMLELCALHQFGVDEPSGALVVVPENWVLVYWLLERGLLVRTLSETEEMELQCRHVTVFCHRLLHVWKWGPGEYPAMSIANYHQFRQYRDMPSEGGYRFPDFLQEMIETSTADLEQDYNIPKDDESKSGTPYFFRAAKTSIVPRIPRLSVDLSLAETVSCSDSTFEIFLKLVILTFHQQIEMISQEPQIFFGPRPFTMVPRMDDPKIPHLETMVLLNKKEKFRTCRRFASKLFCIWQDLKPPQEAVWGPDVSVCSVGNACNVVLVISLMLPDCVQRTSVCDIENIMNPKALHDFSHDLAISTLYHLGNIWQRQAVLGSMAVLGNRHVQYILNFYYARLVELRPIIEKEVRSAEEPKSMNRIALSYQGPATTMAGSILNLMRHLLKSGGKLAPDGTSYPKLAFLDKRLGVFFDPTANFDAELRLFASQVIVEFLEQRKAHKKRLEELSTPKPAIVQALVPGTNVSGQVDVESAALAEDGDFPWLEESMSSIFNDDFLTSSLAESESAKQKPVDVVLKEDEDLMTILKEWVYPALARLIDERRHALFREHTLKNRVTMVGDSANRRAVTASVNPYLKQGANRFPPLAGGDTNNMTQLPDSSSVLLLSEFAIQDLRDTFTDVSMLLMDNKELMMADLEKEFWLQPWEMPVLQRLVLDDKLSWATRVAATSPGMLLTHEDLFLATWFATIGVPLNEMRLQIQFSDAIVKHGLAVRGPAVDINASLDTMPLSGHVFNEVPWSPRQQSIGSDQESLTYDTLLAEFAEEDERLDQLKSVRYHLVAKAVSNIGEHYAELEALLSKPHCSLHRAIQEIRFRYRSYLTALFNSLEWDFKRLEKDKSDTITQHTKFLCDIFTHVLKTCERIMRDDQNFQEQVVFLESVRLMASSKKNLSSDSTTARTETVVVGRES